MDDQRLASLFLEAMHATNDDLVIATGVDVFGAALETRQELGKYRYAVHAFDAVETVELVSTALCKTIAQFL